MSIPAIWKNMSLALGAEPRDYPVVTGLSGVEHEFLSIAVDDKTNRIILVSPDPNARTVALIHVDIQAAMPDTRILIARPILFDLGVLARQVVSVIGTDQFAFSSLKPKIERLIALKQQIDRLPPERKSKYAKKLLGAAVAGMTSALERVTIPKTAQFIALIQQAANFDWNMMLSSADPQRNDFVVSLKGLVDSDNLAADRRHGVCPIPLYELDEQDWKMFDSSDDITAIRDRLEGLGVYQYFFPHSDELILGFVDRGVSDPLGVERAVARSESLGHRVSGTTLVDDEQSIQNTVHALSEAGYLVEGDIGLEVSPEGRIFRSSVRFRPKESVLSKVLARLNINIDPGKLIH